MDTWVATGLARFDQPETERILTTILAIMMACFASVRT
jgi:hypothetical protein